MSHRVIPPQLYAPSDTPPNGFTLEWGESNPDANVLYWQLDELSNLTHHYDQAETTNTYWETNGFSRSTQRAHSGSYSYHAENYLYDTTAMTTTHPLPITKNTLLSFWTWYDIEEDYDKAFVEISTTGRKYMVLDTFTGRSQRWLYQTYDLSEYEGTSVYIRFRFTTDSEVLGAGFYIDDIQPIPFFDDISTLSDTIPTTSWNITSTLGEHWYRIRGFNADSGWGDYSFLLPLILQDPSLLCGGIYDGFYGPLLEIIVPYHVICDTFVPSGNMLTIYPGVTLLFQHSSRLIGQGELIAEGTVQQPIRFLHEQRGIHFTGGFYLANNSYIACK
jgi:hypothetical protein